MYRTILALRDFAPCPAGVAPNGDFAEGKLGPILSGSACRSACLKLRRRKLEPGSWWSGTSPPSSGGLDRMGRTLANTLSSFDATAVSNVSFKAFQRGNAASAGAWPQLLLCRDFLLAHRAASYLILLSCQACRRRECTRVQSILLARQGT